METIYVETTEHKVGKMPLKWFPRLLNAPKKALENFELWVDNTWIHWENLDEDLSVEGFFNYKSKSS